MAIHNSVAAMLQLVRAIIDLVNDVVLYWRDQLLYWLRHPDEKHVLVANLHRAATAETWQDTALRLDAVTGNDLWRQNPVSRHYDYRLIAQRFRQLVTARKAGHRDELAEVVRAGMLRNLGSLGALDLYVHAYSGTKLLIEDYISEVAAGLEELATAPPGRPGSAPDPEERLTRRTFFHDTRQSFGRTALIMHGGTLFGMCHVGVVKGLLDAELLPWVVAGSTVGAIVAALICSAPSSELPGMLRELPDALPKLWSLGDSELYTNSTSAVEGIIRSRYPPEIVLFERWVRARLGDLTFEEAYLASEGRVLNIMVVATTKPGHKGYASLFNYLTTPKVVIRTAVQASIGSNILPGLERVELLVKDHLGRVIPYQHHPPVRHFEPANAAASSNPRYSPYNRLAELFNVNNFVVSVSRPYLAPLWMSEIKYRGSQRAWKRLLSLIRFGSQYRMVQLAEWGLLPRVVRNLFLDEIIPGAFQINIVPEPMNLVSDCMLVLDSHNIQRKVTRWMSIGERGVWPQAAAIWARTAIEYSLKVLYDAIEEGP